MRDVAGTAYVVYDNSWPGLLAMTILGAVAAALLVIGPHGTFLLHGVQVSKFSLISRMKHCARHNGSRYNRGRLVSTSWIMGLNQWDISLIFD